MSKSPVSSAATAVAEPESKLKTTYTNWDTFNKAKLAVKKIVCVPLPGHPADEACKTAFVPTAANVLEHVKGGHGGGFRFVVEPSSTPWPGWNQLEKAGAELQSLRDDVTDHEVNVSVRAIHAVLRPHQGKFRGAYQAFKNNLILHIAFTAPPSVDDDNFDVEPYTE